MDTGKTWLAVGMAGQVIFFSRFLVQWIESERRKQSVIPEVFWYLSILGSALLLAYSVYRKDPVFIAGNSTGFFIYLRNIWFVRMRKKTGDSSRQTS